ncbi:MAG: HAD-IB family phosphatase [Desulfurococcaceae archaeon TW002]
MFCKIRVAAFDMDGVLTKWRSSWRALHEYFGSLSLVSESNDAEKFLRGEITYEEWMRRDLEAIIKALGRSPTKEEIIKAFSRYELVEGAKDLINFLKRRGVYTLIISGGIDLLAEIVRRELGIDAAFANRLVFNEKGYLIPKGIEVVNPLKKGELLKRLSRQLRIPLSEFMYVGDTEWDFEALNAVGYPILLNYGEVKPPAESRYLMVNTLYEIIGFLTKCL